VFGYGVYVGMIQMALGFLPAVIGGAIVGWLANRVLLGPLRFILVLLKHLFLIVLIGIAVLGFVLVYDSFKNSGERKDASQTPAAEEPELPGSQR